MEWWERWHMSWRDGREIKGSRAIPTLWRKVDLETQRWRGKGPYRSWCTQLRQWSGPGSHSWWKLCLSLWSYCSRGLCLQPTPVLSSKAMQMSMTRDAAWNHVDSQALYWADIAPHQQLYSSLGTAEFELLGPTPCQGGYCLATAQTWQRWHGGDWLWLWVDWEEERLNRDPGWSTQLPPRPMPTSTPFVTCSMTWRIWSCRTIGTGSPWLGAIEGYQRGVSVYIHYWWSSRS